MPAIAHVITKDPCFATNLRKSAKRAPICLGMSCKIRVGDRLTLPSGKIVTLSSPADPQRPWRAHGMGTMWTVRREHTPDHVHREAWQYYAGEDTLPLWLTESDAVFLAFDLNRVYPARDTISVETRLDL